MGSPASFVKASASILFVGTHLINALISLQLSRIMTTSMLVRLSSMEVGEEGL